MEVDKKIYHIFHANVTFHNFGFITSFVEYFGIRSFFIISSCCTKEQSDKYVSFFENLGFNQYLILNDDISNAPFFVKFLTKKGVFYANEYKIYSYILTNPNKIYLLHGDFLSTLGKIFLVAKQIRINFVCWGFGKELIGNLYLKIRAKISYMAFSNIVCLMTPELDILKEIVSDNQTLRKLSYFDSLLSYAKNESKKERLKLDLPKLLLGNSGRHILEYDAFLSKIDINAVQGSISCMINYGASESEIEIFESKWVNFINSGKLILLKDIVSQEEYVKMMNKYDMYISPKESQTGLGAIYCSLLLGKKIYITGTNYEFISSLGCKISTLDSVFEDMQTKNIYLLENEKTINKEIVERLLNKDFQSQKWEQFFDEISTKV